MVVLPLADPMPAHGAGGEVGEWGATMMARLCLCRGSRRLAGQEVEVVDWPVHGFHIKKDDDPPPM